MRWRLILEEYGPELHYLKGESNVVADALSRLPSTDAPEPSDMEAQADCFAASATELNMDDFPLRLKQIEQEQNKDSAVKKLARDPTYTLKAFRGGDKTPKGPRLELLVRENKIVIPSALQRRVAQWYHQILCHPGENRTEQTIRQHFYWKDLRKTVQDICSKCDTCQCMKKSTKKYGLLPEKQADVTPWKKLCVDLIGPYSMTPKKSRKKLTLWCLTMIDPATKWFEMVEIKNKEPITIANLVEQTWLTRYPWPREVIYDQGPAFLTDFARMISEDYGITPRPITKKNPQANAVLERAHQTLGNIIRTFQVQDNYLDQSDPWKGILAAAMFALRSTYHMALQATPTQVVFGRDAIMPTKFEANWQLIRAHTTK